MRAIVPGTRFDLAPGGTSRRGNTVPLGVGATQPRCRGWADGPPFVEPPPDLPGELPGPVRLPRRGRWRWRPSSRLLTGRRVLAGRLGPGPRGIEGRRSRRCRWRGRRGALRCRGGLRRRASGRDARLPEHAGELTRLRLLLLLFPLRGRPGFGRILLFCRQLGPLEHPGELTGLRPGLSVRERSLATVDGRRRFLTGRVDRWQIRAPEHACEFTGLVRPLVSRRGGQGGPLGRRWRRRLGLLGGGEPLVQRPEVEDELGDHHRLVVGFGDLHDFPLGRAGKSVETLHEAPAGVGIAADEMGHDHHACMGQGVIGGGRTLGDLLQELIPGREVVAGHGTSGGRGKGTGLRRTIRWMTDRTDG